MRRRHETQKGFTLIELLVVIAIIALLSSVVLASLNTARAKARNAKRSQIVLQYRNALELYRNENSSYPADNATWYCLGEAQGSPVCYGPIYQGNTALNTALAKFIPGMPILKEQLPITTDMHGLIYTCTTATCNLYQLRWYSEGNGACAPGQITGTVLGGSAVECIYSNS